MPALGLLGLGVIIGLVWGWIMAKLLRSEYGGKKAAESEMADLRREMKAMERENTRLQKKLDAKEEE